MRTLLLQHLTGLLLVIFGVLSFLIARRGRGGPRQVVGWWYTSYLFILVAATSVLQMAWGTLAMYLGAEHPVWSAYLRFAPAGNHGRIIALFVFYTFFILLAMRSEPRVEYARNRFAPALVAGFVAGFLLGYYEGGMQAARHYSVTAVLDAISAMAMGVVLLVTLARSTVDRYLWTALAVNGVVSVFAVLFFSAFAWKAHDAAWWPSQLWLMFVRNGGLFLMILLAWQRYVLDRNNRPIPGFFGAQRRGIAIG